MTDHSTTRDIYLYMIYRYGFHSLFLTDVVVELPTREVVPLYAGVGETVERHTVL